MRGKDNTCTCEDLQSGWQGALDTAADNMLESHIYHISTSPSHSLMLSSLKEKEINNTNKMTHDGDE